MNPWTRRGLVGTSILAGAGVLSWVGGPPTDPDAPEITHEPEASLEQPLAADAAMAARVFARARARLADPGGGALADGLDGVSGPRLWLCAYQGGDPPVCGVGDAGSVGAAVDAAVALLAATAVVPGAVLKLDWQLARTQAAWPVDADPHAAGTFGLAVGPAVILPSEVIERGVYAVDPGADDEDPTYRTPRLRALLAARGADVGDRFAFDRLRTASWIEAGERAVRTYRVHPYDYVPTDADTVLDRALWAAEALSRSVDPDGRIRYEWDVRQGKEKRGYNLLRHAGSTFALIQAYGRTGHPEWREAAGRALDHLVSKSASDERTGPYGGGTVRYLVEGSHIKLGGAALALVALTTWQSTTGDTAYAATAREFATFLVSQQQQDGEFVYFASREPGGAPRDDTSAYYPGEAVLGLALFAGVDADPVWLATAVRGADWLIDVRDAGKGPDQLDNDHWLAMALRALFERTGDRKYADHAARIAAAVAAQHERQAGHDAFHRDYLGGYYEPPRSTPAATRAEALAAVLELGELAPDVRTARVALLQQTLQHVLQSQYTPDVLYWMPRPDEVVGGLAGGIVDPELRNDYTQHALSALLATERVLRAPEVVAPLDPDALARRLAPIRAVDRAIEPADPAG